MQLALQIPNYDLQSTRQSNINYASAPQVNSRPYFATTSSTFIDSQAQLSSPTDSVGDDQQLVSPFASPDYSASAHSSVPNHYAAAPPGTASSPDYYTPADLPSQKSTFTFPPTGTSSQSMSNPYPPHPPSFGNHTAPTSFQPSSSSSATTTTTSSTYQTQDDSTTEDQSQQQYSSHRRMSEPAVLAPTSSTFDFRAATRYPPFEYSEDSLASLPRSEALSYSNLLHRGSSLNSLRDVRAQHMHYSAHQHSHHPPQPHSQPPSHGRTLAGSHDHYSPGHVKEEDQLSPLTPDDYSGRFASSPGGAAYQTSSEDVYGPSPPGTATSTSSNPQVMSPEPGAHPLHSQQSSDSAGDSPTDPSKTYSFVSLPGNSVKKRPRRRYDEIERLYHCSWPDCNKSYGTLNHLNAHVTMQKHGQKRSPAEFKDLRKMWRKQKKDAELARANVLRVDEYPSHGEFSRYSSPPHSQAFPPTHHHRHHSLEGRYQLQPTAPPPSGLRYASSVDNISGEYRSRGVERWPPPLLPSGQPNSWAVGSTNPPGSSSRVLQQPYVPAPYPAQQHASSSISDPRAIRYASEGRLHPGNTLLTPVSNYHATSQQQQPPQTLPSLLPPLSASSTGSFGTHYSYSHSPSTEDYDHHDYGE